MPSTSEKQRRFMGAELARKRAGKKTETGMSEQQLADFAKKRKKSGKKMPTHGSGPLTPLGSRTLAGYEEKWGDGPGHAKFEKAVETGILSRERMFRRDAKGSFQRRTG